jgi:hypothetical protein
MKSLLPDVDLKDLAVAHAKEFLIREEVPEEEAEMAFGGYCVGFCDGYMLACKHMVEKLERDGELQ